ncbi:MAG TPA: NusG domain II-containing protein [Clostridiales bacterium]|nr:NusG domain II-containing protein [Clostridiales bacterium]
MKKKWPFILIGSLLLIGILGSILVLRRPGTNLVEIVQDGRILYQLDLAQAEDQTIEVEYDGRINIIEIKNHQIHMLDAECPDHTCVNMGWLDSAVPIVCLPNHLVIQFSGDNDAMDGTVG